MPGIDDASKAVAVGIHGVDDASKVVTIETALSRRAPKRAASVPALSASAAKRGRIATDTASGSPALSTTTIAGSPATAAPITISIDTATALAVADPKTCALDEALDNGGHDGFTACEATGPASDEDAAAAGSSANAEAVVAPRSPASASSVEEVGGRGAVPVSPSPAPAAVASHARAHGGDSKPDTIIANPASRVRPGCADTPVVARLPVPRPHAVAGTAGPAVPVAARSGPIRAFSIGRAASNTAHALSLAPAVPPSSATALRYLPMRLPQHPPETIAALCLLSAAVPHGEPDPDPAVEEDIQAGFKRIKSTMNALFTGQAVPHNGFSVTSPPPESEDDDYEEEDIDYEEVDVEQQALQMYADRPEDPWNVEDADFDPRLYVEDPEPKWRVGLLL